MQLKQEGWRAWLRWFIPNAAGLESTRNLAKWAVLSTLVGLVSGGGAILFYKALDLATAGFLGALVGYAPPMSVGEGVAKVMPIGRPWALPLVTRSGD